MVMPVSHRSRYFEYIYLVVSSVTFHKTRLTFPDEPGFILAKLQKNKSHRLHLNNINSNFYSITVSRLSTAAILKSTPSYLLLNMALC